jgi:integrase
MQVIGRLGTVTLDQARERARELLSRATLGEDVAADQRATRSALSVAEVAAAFMEDRDGKIKPATLAEYRRLIAVEIAPAIGKRVARDLSRQEVARLHSSNRRTPYVANRVRSLLGAIYRWAGLRGYVPEGLQPTRGVEAYPERGRERYLTDAELARLGSALRRALKDGIPPDPKRAQYNSNRRGHGRDGRPSRLYPANPFAVNAIRMLLLSGWREQEVLALEWSSLDLESGRARLQDTKTGLSWRPLGGAALQLLLEMPRIQGSRFVFPGGKPTAPLTDIKHVWHAVRDAAGLPDVRLHDLRHHFASAGAQRGISLAALGAVLGHREIATTKKYAHLGEDPTKRAADEIAAAVASSLAGATEKPAHRQFKVRRRR